MARYKARHCRRTGGRGFVATVAMTAGLAMVPSPLSASVPTDWTESTPGGGAPGGRVSSGHAYDAGTDSLMVFSGYDPLSSSPGYNTDTWVLSGATTATPTWTLLAPATTPQGRSGHSAVYAPASNKLVVYGGCLSSCGFADNQVWVLSNANGSGGPPVWTNLATSGADNREGHVGAYDPTTNSMIVFGGQHGFNSYGSNPQVRVLSNADGTGVGTPTWTTLSPAGTRPSDREAVGLAYDATSNRAMVFGGFTLTCCASIVDVYNDVWVLTNANGQGGTPAWTQLAPLGTPPPDAYWPTAQYDPSSNRLMVFGGTVDAPTTYNDVWVLTNANGLGGTPEWVKLTPTGGPPHERFGHAAAYSQANNAMVITFGRDDDDSGPYTVNYFDDVWVLHNANATYPFTGFFSPVDNLPVLNGMKAGAAVPLKFSLGGDRGLDIFVAGYPKSSPIACSSSALVDGVEETVAAGGSSLTYDAATDRYQYVWKTLKAWAGTCRQLVLRFDDGSTQRANFSLK